MKYFLPLMAFLMGCNEVVYAPMEKYELSTDEYTVKHQCRSYFKKFHGKYEIQKHYGKNMKVSTLHIYEQPDCAMACITDTFSWECSFKTDDEDDGLMIFQSKLFKE